MYEAEGTTPEPAQDSTTPSYKSTIEKARDFYASKDKSMFTYEELYAKASSTEQQLANLEKLHQSLKADLNFLMEKKQVADSTISKAGNWVKDQVEGSMDPKQTIEEFEGLIDILGVEMTRKVEIEIAVSWRGSIELPYGVEVDDLDVDDFDISISQHNEYDSDISYYFESSDISEH